MIDETDRWLLSVAIFEWSKELNLGDEIRDLKFLIDCGYDGFVSLDTLKEVKIGDYL